jgi:hypothetical protein
MEDFREISLEEIESRLIRDKEILGLASMNRNNNNPINKTNVPAIYMFEGRDVIENYTQRNVLGYPLRRHLEINIEIVAKTDRKAKGVKALLNLVRRSVFCDRTGEGEDIVWTPNPIVAQNSLIRELRIKGPGTYEVPELVGIKLVVGLWYTDNGFL